MVEWVCDSENSDHDGDDNNLTVHFGNNGWQNFEDRGNINGWRNANQENRQSRPLPSLSTNRVKQRSTNKLSDIEKKHRSKVTRPLANNFLRALKKRLMATIKNLERSAHIADNPAAAPPRRPIRQWLERMLQEDVNVKLVQLKNI